MAWKQAGRARVHQGQGLMGDLRLWTAPQEGGVRGRRGRGLPSTPATRTLNPSAESGVS